MADESDDRDDEREVLTNLPRTRPARRSTRRASATPGDEDAPAPKPKTPPKPQPRARRAPAPPPLPRPQPAHRSLLGDIAVTSIELTGELFLLGLNITRAIVGATLRRVPRP